MKFQVHYELRDGSEDSFFVEADTVDEIRTIAGRELHKRGGLNPWSQQIDSAVPQYSDPAGGE